MNKAQAQRAISTLEDVFTQEGDAVVVASTRVSKREDVEGVKVSGYGYSNEPWLPLHSLTATEDL